MQTALCLFKADFYSNRALASFSRNRCRNYGEAAARNIRKIRTESTIFYVWKVSWILQCTSQV